MHEVCSLRKGGYRSDRRGKESERKAETPRQVSLRLLGRIGQRREPL